MPRKRTELAREQKVEQILDIAERRLLDDGYNGLSIAAIARDLGLAQNAVRWYFSTRDHLLVATLRRILEQIAARKPRARDDVERIRERIPRRP